jgi:hypothetical protein
MAEDHEHHEKHDHDDQASKEEAEEFAWAAARHGLLPSARQSRPPQKAAATGIYSTRLLDGAFGGDPLFFDGLDFADQGEIFRLRQHFFQVLGVAGFVE